MIAQLRGILAAIGDDHAIIDVAGVGYLVAVAPATLERLPRVGEAVELHTELHCARTGSRSTASRTPADRTWFRLLQTVQGVGARVALSLLGTLRPNELANAIAAGDKAMLARASGVGARLAARIVSELKDRVGALPQAGRGEPPGGGLAGGAIGRRAVGPAASGLRAAPRPMRRWPGCMPGSAPSSPSTRWCVRA